MTLESEHQIARTFEQWLEYIEQQHPDEIELGLERVKAVLARLIPEGIQLPVITVAGTNGKGSTIACIEQQLLKQGMSCLVYTSPHFNDYRERVTHNGQWLTKAEHLAAFEAVENARQATRLTYFEYATLAALYIASQLAKQSLLDCLILEVGLGGRLDAVNMLEADIGIITSVDFDHQDWLGDTLEQIAYEKAGIIHDKTHAILADQSLPSAIVEQVQARAKSLYQVNDNTARELSLEQPIQAVQQSLSFPVTNLLAAYRAVWQLSEMLGKVLKLQPTEPEALHLPGRMQRLQSSPEVFADVAHNPQAIGYLVKRVQAMPQAKHRVVLGMLKDKNRQQCIAQLAMITDDFYLTDLPEPRGSKASDLKALVPTSETRKMTVHCFQDPLSALDAALLDVSKEASTKGLGEHRILVLGSFHTLAPILKQKTK